ncbi:hypothetical protein chiPu_0028233, partial [Chiloscyllium punctatum]|nr:hypothetical protein [Chiloscyllium punctatum]
MATLRLSSRLALVTGNEREPPTGVKNLWVGGWMEGGVPVPVPVPARSPALCPISRPSARAHRRGATNQPINNQPADSS